MTDYEGRCGEPKRLASGWDAHTKEMISVSAERDRAVTACEQLGQRIEQIRREAAAIADALGERGLVDFADDVRMLTKL